MAESKNLPGNSLNEPTAKKVSTRSRFPLPRKVYTTLRFGDIYPHFALEAVANDTIRMRCDHDLRTMSLQTPLMSPGLSMKKDYFAVPMQAILPRQWEKIFVNPLKGDDVPADANCVTSFMQFASLVYMRYEDLKAFTSTTSDSFAQMQNMSVSELTHGLNNSLAVLLNFALTFESVYSSGSLFNSLGYKYHQNVIVKDPDTDKSMNADWLLDYIYSELSKVKTARFKVFAGMQAVNNYEKKAIFDDYLVVQSGAPMEVIKPTSQTNVKTVTWRQFLEIARESLCVYGTLPVVSGDGRKEALIEDLNHVISAMYKVSKKSSTGDMIDYVDFLTYAPDAPVNISRIAAYQIVASHFYSNDKIDTIFSADLYRALMESLGWSCLSENYRSFRWNGTQQYYDALSGSVMYAVFEKAMTSQVYKTSYRVFLEDFAPYQTDTNAAYAGIAYYANLMCYKKSLRFLDYFTGSRTQPLAVGDTSVAVQSGKVSIVDVTKNIQAQRFLNAVNRSGRKFSNYLQEIFGDAPGYDYHNPEFVAHTSDYIGAYETQNTGEAQTQEANSITANIRSNSGKFEFEFHAECPLVLIGVTYFDVRRAYKFAMDRQLFHKDRYDMFNPFMQFIGDQPIYLAELYPNTLAAEETIDQKTFGYTLRNMEYKQTFDTISGAFQDQLDTYCFSSDDALNEGAHQGSSFIRSKNSEIDKYYVQAPGWSLGHYYHFIVCFENSVDASRPMAAAPSIL